MEIKTILLIIICGIALALLSALYSQDMSPGLGATITGYGLPWAWLQHKTTIVPGLPEEISLYDSGLYLLADIVVWTAIVAAIYVVYKQLKK